MNDVLRAKPLHYRFERVGDKIQLTAVQIKGVWYDLNSAVLFDQWEASLFYDLPDKVKPVLELVSEP